MSSDILNMSSAIYTLYSLLTCKIVVLISANCVLIANIQMQLQNIVKLTEVAVSIPYIIL